MAAKGPTGDAEFGRLLEEAESQPFHGWDFSWLGSRMTTTALPWDYEAIVLPHARVAPDMLDMGTGGGERLSALPFRPPRTVATEGWPPNVDVAGARLRPLGVTVVSVEGAPDNVDQGLDERHGQLPFPSESFALVVNRHESFLATEVARVLAPSGRFVTQQVGAGRGDLFRLLGLPVPVSSSREWNLALAIEQVERAGLAVVESGEGEQVTSFADVGAVAWYLTAVPWEVQGFSIRAARSGLARLHARIHADGPVSVRRTAFWLSAQKPERASPG